MRTALSKLELVRPSSLKDALRALANDPRLVPIAGCTDVYVLLEFGALDATRFLDLRPIAALCGIRRLGGATWIGAGATYTDVIRSPLVKRALPMLVAASREVGGAQIQNRGTIGGNVANGSPAGDTLPVLAAADAIVVLASVSGSRRVPITSFHTGYRASVRRPEELIVGIEVPPVEGRQWFAKVGTRRAQAISKIVIAAVRDGNRARIALGSVAPTVVRATATEAAIAGGLPREAIERALRADTSPIDDVRSTAAYRSGVLARLVHRFLAETS